MPDAEDPSEPVPAEARRSAIRDSLGVGLAVGSYGFAFGAASVAAGLSVLQTCLLSLLTFTGGTQFAVVGVVAGGGTLAAALGSGLLLGSRNMLYAMRLAPLLRVRGPRRLVAAHGTIDESTAMAVAWSSGGTPARQRGGEPTAMAVGRRSESLARIAFWTTFAGTFTVWNVATLLGAVGASAVGDPSRFGLDAVIPAAFLALVAPWLRRGAVERRVGLGAAVLAAVLVPLTPPGVPIIASCAALLLAVRLPPRRREAPA